MSDEGTETPEAPKVDADELRENSPEVAPAEPTPDGEPDGSEPAGSAEVEPEVPTGAEPPAPEGAVPTPAEVGTEPTPAEVGTEPVEGEAKPERLATPLPGDAFEPAPAPVRKKDLAKPPRRRRKTAAERHRGAFFAKLGELRRGVEPPEPEQPAAEAPAAEPAVEQPAAEPAVEQPSAEQPAAEAPAPEPAPTPEPPSPARAQARLAAAIERVGGAERIQEALQPKRDDKGEAKKWAAVCCDAAEGVQPPDPVFQAWVRLAATPVREIKAQIRPPREERQGGRPRGGGRDSGPGAKRRQMTSGRSGGGGGDRRPRREGGPPRDRSIQDAAKDLLSDGSFKPTVRIVGTDAAEEKRERERRRKEQREAKRQAERERLARLGY